MVALGNMGIPLFHKMLFRGCNIVNKPLESVDKLLFEWLGLPVFPYLNANMVVSAIVGKVDCCVHLHSGFPGLFPPGIIAA